jgi:hypothetical protein
VTADALIMSAAYLVGPFLGTLLAGLVLIPVAARQVVDRLAETLLADEQPGRRRAPDSRAAPQHAVGTASPARPMSAWDTQVHAQVQPPTWPVDATQPVARVGRADDETARLGRIR